MTWTKQAKAVLGGSGFLGSGGFLVQGFLSTPKQWTKQTKPTDTWSKLTKPSDSWTKLTKAS